MKPLLNLILSSHARVCVCVSHPIIVRRKHKHQAPEPGWYVTSVVTTRWQCGQRTKPGMSLRYDGLMRAGWGWVTTALWLLLTGALTPTGMQRTRGAQRWTDTKGEVQRMLFAAGLLVLVQAAWRDSNFEYFVSQDGRWVGCLAHVTSRQHAAWVESGQETDLAGLWQGKHTNIHVTSRMWFFKHFYSNCFWCIGKWCHWPWMNNWKSPIEWDCISPASP